MTNVYKYITDTKFSNVINIILIKSIFYKYLLWVNLSVFFKYTQTVFIVELRSPGEMSSEKCHSTGGALHNERSLREF